jgi:5-methylcytosine-specific restriction endonuclease McrA
MNSVKTKIPRSLREQLWIKDNGLTFESKCQVTWCKNIITPFTFHAGHNIPESKGGRTDLSNLKTICPSCNLSMGNNFSIDEFSEKYSEKPEPKVVVKKRGLTNFCCFFCEK